MDRNDIVLFSLQRLPNGTFISRNTIYLFRINHSSNQLKLNNMACSKCIEKKQAAKEGCKTCGTKKNTNKNIRTRGTR